MTNLNNYGFLLILISTIAASDKPAIKCFFNEKCNCVDNGRKIFSNITCIGVQGFPEFKLEPGAYAVQYLVISGVIKEMPQGGLDMFKYVKHATIERTNGDEAFSIQGGEPYILANCQLYSLTIRGFLDVLPLSSASGYGLGIHPKTLAQLAEMNIQSSTVRFTDDAFTGADSLVHLSLTDDHIADGAFRSQIVFSRLNDSLLLLDMSNNKMEIYEPAFQLLENLDSLLLNANELRNLSAANFSHFVHLNRLGLGQNRLTTFDGPSLFPSGDHQLEELDLAGNQLNSIPYEALNRLPQLTKLLLSSNNITNLTVPLPNSKLVQLALDYNPIQELPLNGFSNLRSLRDVSVTGWDVDELDLSAFNGTALERLVIHNNSRLHTLTYSNLSSVPITLSKIDISGNNLTVISSSFAHLFKNNIKLTITISNETNFDCNQESDSDIVLVRGNVTSTSGPQQDPSLSWLANLAACEEGNRIQIDESSVYCAWKPGQNASEPIKLIDFLRSLDHNCTANPTTPVPSTTPGQHAPRLSSRVLDSLIVFTVGMVLTMRI